jgi:predicted MFS family arabinose efflux permease
MVSFDGKPLVRDTSPPAVQSEFRQGWRMLIVAVLGMSSAPVVIPFYTIGAFIIPLREQFGWSRGSLQYAVTAMSIGTIPSTIICGWLLRRFKLRNVLIGSLVAHGLAWLIFTRLSASIWSLYGAIFVVMIAGAGLSPVSWTQGVNLWFERRRGLALAITTSGAALGTVFGPMYATALIEAYGLRPAFIGLALPTLLITLPATVFLMPRNEPGARAAVDGEPRAALPGLTFGEALRSWRMWVLSLAVLAVVAGIMGLVPNMIPILRDRGLSAAEAARLAGSIGMVYIATRVVVGPLLDRLWAPAVGAAVLCVPMLTCGLLLADLRQEPLLILAVLLIGIGFGPEMEVVSYLTARYFGMRDYGRICALQYTLLAVGGASVPVLYGSLYDATGRYTAMLWICLTCFVVGPLMLLSLGRYPVFGHVEPRLG